MGDTSSLLWANAADRLCQPMALVRCWHEHPYITLIRRKFLLFVLVCVCVCVCVCVPKCHSLLFGPCVCAGACTNQEKWATERPIYPLKILGQGVGRCMVHSAWPSSQALRCPNLCIKSHEWCDLCCQVFGQGNERKRFWSNINLLQLFAQVLHVLDVFAISWDAIRLSQKSSLMRIKCFIRAQEAACSPARRLVIADQMWLGGNSWLARERSGIFPATCHISCCPLEAAQLLLDRPVTGRKTSWMTCKKRPVPKSTTTPLDERCMKLCHWHTRPTVNLQANPLLQEMQAHPHISLKCSAQIESCQGKTNVCCSTVGQNDGIFIHQIAYG